MKKRIFIFLLILSIIPSYSQKWENILYEVLQGASNAIVQNQVAYKPVGSYVVEVNSATKFMGDTRKVIKIELPNFSEGFYYRITPMYIEYNYLYNNDESLYMNIINRNPKPATPNFGTYASVDVFLMDNSADSYKFDNKMSFNYFRVYERIYTSCLIENSAPMTVYLGIRNPNGTIGLRVIVEVVAFGYYNTY